LVEGFRCDGGNAEEERDGGRKGMWKRKGRRKNLVRWVSGDSIQSGENDRAIHAPFSSFAHSLQQKKNPSRKLRNRDAKFGIAT